MILIVWMVKKKTDSKDMQTCVSPWQIVQSCVSCLGAVVNIVTHNYKLVRDCFQKFFGELEPSLFKSVLCQPVKVC